MHRPSVQAAIALVLVVLPFGTLAQTPPGSPPHADDALPFGQWTIVNHQVDESALVWSRCRGRNGASGRWVATRPAEVVHPTYVVQQEPLMKNRASWAANVGTLVECIADDGSPGMPDPAVPPTTVLPRGTTIAYGTAVSVQYADPERHTARHYGFGLHDNETAFDDGSGPVIVTAGRIAVFARSSTLSVGGPSNVDITIRRPGSPAAATPTTCTVELYNGQEPAERNVVATESKSCTALLPADRDRLIRNARTQLGSL
jgi:hypothetical protein